MPWKTKSRPRRTKWTPRPSLARAVAKKAPRRYEWVGGLDTPCVPEALPPHVCSPCEVEGNVDTATPIAIDPVTGQADTGGPAPPVRFVIWDPIEGDAVGLATPAITDDFMIVRIHGHISLIPYFTALWTAEDCEGYEDPMNCSNQRVSGQYDNYFARWGLVKDKFIATDRYFNGPNQTVGWTPPTRDPMNPPEWIDGRFAKQGEKEWFNRTQLSFLAYNEECGDLLGPCPNVTGSGGDSAAVGAPTNTLSNGSGTVNIPATNEIDISTTCIFPSANGFGGVTSSFERPPMMRINLNMRRRFRMQESEGLSLWFNYTARNFVQASGIPAPLRQGAVGFYAVPNFRMLVELP